jgi:hypothetical protein
LSAVTEVLANFVVPTEPSANLALPTAASAIFELLMAESATIAVDTVPVSLVAIKVPAPLAGKVTVLFPAIAGASISA